VTFQVSACAENRSNLLWRGHFAGIVPGAEAASIAAEPAGAHVGHAEAV